MAGDTKLVRVFIRALGLALFVSYPLALLPPGIVALPYHLRVPTEVVLGLLAICVVVRCPLRAPGWLWVALAGFVLCAVANFATWRSQWPAYITVTAQVVVPLAVAVAWGCYKPVRELRIAQVLTALWVLTAAWDLAQQAQGRPPTGISGNRNWEAALLLALLPWTWGTCANRRRGRWLWWLIIFPLSVYLILSCRSRGAVLAAGIVLAGWLLLSLARLMVQSWQTDRSRCWRLTGAMLLLICLGAGGLGFAARTLVVDRLDWMVARIAEDVRLPMYGASMRMICANDLVLRAVSDPMPLNKPLGWLGVGAGRFRSQFAPYRSLSTYHFRDVRAPVTEHPHNELLYTAAQIGWPAALCWLMLLLPAIPALLDRGPRKWAALSLGFLVIHGQLDLVLARPPTNMLSWLFLGLVWAPWIQPGPAPKKIAAHWRRSLYSIAILALFWGASSRLYKEVRTSSLMRRASLAEAQAHAGQIDWATIAAMYAKAAAIDPSNVHGAFYAGVIYLERIHAPRQALPYLRAVQQREAHFAHINGLLGKAAGSLGMHEQAAEYFSLNCALYPLHAPSLLQSYTALAFLGRMHELPALEDRFRTVTLTQAESVKAERHVRDFADAVARGDITTSINLARQICKGQESRVPDPLLHYIVPDHPLPRRYIHGDFEAIDFMLWKRAQSGDLLAANWNPDQCLQDFAASLPGESVLDRCDMAAATAQTTGLTTWIRPTDPVTVYALGEQRGACPDALVLDAGDRVILPPPALLAKNITLGIILSAHGIDWGAGFARLPTAQLSETCPDEGLHSLGQRVWKTPYRLLGEALGAKRE